MLLTDEEIARHIAHNCEGCKTKGNIFHEIGKPVAKAQLKKVVEWLDERNHRKGRGFEDGCLLVHKKDWQSLLDEVK